VTVLAIVEGLVRLSGIASRHVPDRVYRFFDADIPYVHAPNLRNVRGWGNTRFDTDALGLRSTAGGEPPAAQPAHAWRVALVGDSVTFGEGVATADVFAERLRQRLASSDIHVLNFGVSGYSVRQIAATVDRRVGVAAPDLVVIALLPADFELARTGTLDAWGSVRPSGGSDALEWLKVPLRRLHLPYALLDLARGPRAGWRSLPIADVPASFSYVASLPATCDARRLACAVVLLSTKIDDGFGPIAEPLRRLGLPLLDLTHLKDAFTTEAFDAGPYDPHPSAAVHARIAEALAPWILALRDGARLPQ
jgi:hypothetical protein